MVLISSSEDLIGSTPILRASHCRPAGGAEILLKLEGFSSSGSVKARAARQMLDGAAERGELPPGRAIVEPSSGNLGIALAMLCAQRSIPCWLVLDSRTTDFSRRVMHAYGAQTVTVKDKDERGSWQGSRLAAAREIADSRNALLLYQYGNGDNPMSHEEGTSREIIEAITPQPDVCVVGVSTGGQLSGIGRGLRGRGVSPRMVAVDIEGSSIFGGPYNAYLLRGLGLSWWPGNLEPAMIDDVYRVDERFAFQVSRAIAVSEGLLVGGAGGAVIAACVAEAAKLGRSQTVLGVIAERGDRYVRQFYDRAWLLRHGLTTEGPEAAWEIAAEAMRPLAGWRDQAEEESERRKELNVVR